jgi:hypothetical protein
MEVIFQTTDSGRHVIEMGEHGRLIFSEMTKTPEGYRFLAYGRNYVQAIAVRKSDGSRAYHEVYQRDSQVFNLKMKRDSAGTKGVPRGSIPQKLTDWLIKTFDEFAEGEIIPYYNIPKLKEKINSTNFTKVLAKRKPKKKKIKKRKKPPTKKQIKSEKNAMAILRRSVDEKTCN